MRRPDWSVGVVIPACNEEDSIVACLHAVFLTLDRCLVKASWVVVVADSCADASADLARSALGSRGAVVECSAASPGMARRIGAAEVLSHFSRERSSQVWIANTDADSCVAPSWMARQLELAGRGYCGVAGIVRVASVEGLDRATFQALFADYEIREDGTHPHVHGANLGVRADAYMDAGCWSSLAVAEDHCLWSRLKARGWPTASCSKTIVHTSGRLRGRATGGFADALRSKLELLRARAVACTR